MELDVVQTTAAADNLLFFNSLETSPQKRGWTVKSAIQASVARADPARAGIDPVAEPGRAAGCLVPAIRRDQRHGT